MHFTPENIQTYNDSLDPGIHHFFIDILLPTTINPPHSTLHSLVNAFTTHQRRATGYSLSSQGHQLLRTPAPLTHTPYRIYCILRDPSHHTQPSRDWLSSALTPTPSEVFDDSPLTIAEALHSDRD